MTVLTDRERIVLAEISDINAAQPEAWATHEDVTACVSLVIKNCLTVNKKINPRGAYRINMVGRAALIDNEPRSNHRLKHCTYNLLGDIIQWEKANRTTMPYRPRFADYPDIKELNTRGLVTVTQTDPHDKRKCNVVVTDLGRIFHNNAEGLVQ